jgi:hypothetical protein
LTTSASTKRFTNKKQATWTYDYDATGRMVSETDPAVDFMYAFDESRG